MTLFNCSSLTRISNNTLFIKHHLQATGKHLSRSFALPLEFFCGHVIRPIGRMGCAPAAFLLIYPIIFL